jgi:Tfp pilus assembly protein PilO
MRLKEREKRVLGLGALAAVGIVAWTYVVSPMQQRWQLASARLKSSRADLTKLRRAAQDRSYYAGRRKQVAGRVIETADLEASQRVIPVLINEVESCGRRRQLRVDRYEPLPPKIEDSYAVYSLNLNFHSDLGTLVDFMKDLREARPVINVKRLHVTPPGPDAKIQQLTVEMMLSTFVVRKARTGV